MTDLRQMSEQLGCRYAAVRRVTVPPQKLAITEDGHLILDNDRLELGSVAWDALGRFSGIPPSVLPRFDSSERAYLFNHRLPRAHELGFPSQVAISISSDSVIGMSDASLLQVDVPTLMEVLTGTIPEGLHPEEIAVDQCDVSETGFEVRLFSPRITDEPRRGDVVNGGVSLRYSVVGEHGTQVQCFLRRLVCANGMISHVCIGNAHGRARRLDSDRHQVEDMRLQLERLLTSAWSQLTDKLAALRELMSQPAADDSIYAQYRTRLSLNRRVVRAIMDAMYADELARTNSFFDFVNALSRVATHGNGALLTARQRRTLLRAAGEFSQRHVRRCEACGSWLDETSMHRGTAN